MAVNGTEAAASANAAASATTTTATPAAMGLGAAALVTVVIVLLIAGFIVLGTTLGVVPLYAGFLLLWYFGSIDVLDPALLPAVAVGAVCGTLTAWLLQYGVINWGPAGALPAVGIIVAAIFLQLLGKLPIAINRAYMLYVTVMAMPLVQTHERFDQALLSIALATLYFGGIVWIGRRVAASRAARSG